MQPPHRLAGTWWFAQPVGLGAASHASGGGTGLVGKARLLRWLSRSVQRSMRNELVPLDESAVPEEEVQPVIY